ncbi:hypothetical protein [Sideroxydans lithotrophicus]|uniref:DnaT DNA-binding domain-containing protein n=1 Tax=Sideroxydans lithotrophicus (strain ES-1) TaxID=580332 RepID=D5CT79_SIDLE|nr:hypothetical protein [Sideroxydans lithotrophicus]ADE12165.1 hypothetical protein Slit_1936 [Sideroxydans lithotrophicus ES-1]
MARIRTVKPEFFTHEDLYVAEIEEKLPLRVAFAGLWTVCDREGRFKWKPNTIKLAVLPFDELDFSRVLDALAARGFIEQYESESGELFGFVPSFLEHQVINNRESESNIPSPFDACSTRDPRGLCMHKGKGRERKGKEEEGKGKEPAADASAFSLPDWIDHPTWDLWLKTRKGKKMIPEQMQAQVNKLSKWRDAGLDHAKALSDAATAGWQGLFEPKPTVNKVDPQRDKDQAREGARARLFGGADATA